MSDEQTTDNNPIPMLARRAVGSFDTTLFAGAPADAVISMILDRAGVPYDHGARPESTPATHMAHEGSCDRLPDPFPPAVFAGKLQSAQDWLDLIESNRQRPTGQTVANVVVVNKLIFDDPEPASAPAESAPVAVAAPSVPDVGGSPE